MLTKLRLVNFRGFEDHEVPFRKTSIVVGRNNAGKSTIVEALRLVSIVTRRYRGLAYQPPPDWLKRIPHHYFGTAPDIKNLEIDFETICYEYRNPPAQILAEFENGSTIHIYLSPEKRIHAVIFDADGQPITSRSAAHYADLPHVAIMPQAGPLSREERILNSDYVRGALDSHLAPIHFRNQLYLLEESFEPFRHLAEESWPGFRIMSLDVGQPARLFLQVRNEEFVGEVSKMGHGLQMWLQTMWFLTRSQGASTIILDEPDVYMHADLQRRLIRHLRARASQVVVATHSIEIMSEVEPDQLVIIERKRRNSTFADSFPAVQDVIQRVGSAHNIHLTRLWNARRFLIVEGDDIKILRHFYDTLFPDEDVSLEAIPNISIGGWGGWNWAIGSTIALKNAFGEQLTTYCIFDRDLHLVSAIEERMSEARTRGVQLHIWEKKELENYLLQPLTIARLISKRTPHQVSPERISEAIARFASEGLDDALDSLATELSHQDRKLGTGGANKKARKLLSELQNSEGLENIVSGKMIIRRLSAWIQEEWGTSISAVALARSFTLREIPSEIRDVLLAINGGKAFPSFEPQVSKRIQPSQVGPST